MKIDFNAIDDDLIGSGCQPCVSKILGDLATLKGSQSNPLSAAYVVPPEARPPRNPRPRVAVHRAGAAHLEAIAAYTLATDTFRNAPPCEHNHAGVELLLAALADRVEATSRELAKASRVLAAAAGSPP